MTVYVLGCREGIKAHPCPKTSCCGLVGRAMHDTVVQCCTEGESRELKSAHSASAPSCPLMMWIRSYACISVCRYILYVSTFYFAKGRELKSAPSATSVFPSPPPCDTRPGISATFQRIMSSLGFNSNHCLTLLGR